MLRTIFKREEASTDYFVRLSVRLYVHMPDMTVSSLSTYRSSENLVYMIFFKVYTPLFPAYVFYTSFSLQIHLPMSANEEEGERFEARVYQLVYRCVGDFVVDKTVIPTGIFNLQC